MVAFVLEGGPFGNYSVKVFFSFSFVRAGQCTVLLQAVPGTLQINTHQQCVGSTL